ncbi:RNase h2 complex component domain-containing protein [Ditylenchus destructor]|uniref:RNase h2 complex component domain-containing protein n=1 Tax=Ditylenchus destructor TaxID=166010 RepID=A0AAD4MXF6_9BILA|nr:RNase h2 complex component domain-containing protein [Ditylenchus destructor]
MGRVTRSASSLSQQSRSSEVDENSQDSTSSLTEVLTCNSKSIQPDLSYHRKFVIAKENLTSTSTGVFALRHPKTGTRAYYNFDASGSVQELLEWNHGKRSFFYGDSVVSDGSIVMLSPVHPLFLILRYVVQKAQNRYVSLEDCLDDDSEFPAVKLLLANEKLQKALRNVTDVKTIEDETFYRCNEESLLIWLEKRFNILLESLTRNGDLHKSVLNNPDALRRYTFGVLCDFLPEAVATVLKTRLEIKDVEVFAEPTKNAGKRVAANAMDGDEENFPAVKKTPTISRASKQLQEASKGTKSLASFFTKKAE